MAGQVLTLRAIKARAVMVPMRRPLTTATGAFDKVPFVVVDVHTDRGIDGCACMFSPTPAGLKPLVELVHQMGQLIGGDAVAPFAIEQKLMKHFALFALQGMVQMAISAIDTACWDILAKERAVPLAVLLGGRLRAIPAYNSCGLGIATQDKIAREAGELAAPGFRAVKLRLGYATAAQDVAAVRAARSAIGAETMLMCDYNQGLTAAEAMVRGRALDSEGLYWIEEPTDAHDHAGNAAIARALHTPVQIGENYWGWRDMARAIAAHASDYTMPDLIRIGGVSGWMRAAALADGHGIPMSSHLYPEISVHLLAVTPTAHWLEYVDWADAIVAEPLAVSGGKATPPDRPGHGMRWNEAAIAKLAVG